MFASTRGRVHERSRPFPVITSLSFHFADKPNESCTSAISALFPVTSQGDLTVHLHVLIALCVESSYDDGTPVSLAIVSLANPATSYASNLFIVVRVRLGRKQSTEILTVPFPPSLPQPTSKEEGKRKWTARGHWKSRILVVPGMIERAVSPYPREGTKNRFGDVQRCSSQEPLQYQPAHAFAVRAAKEREYLRGASGQSACALHGEVMSNTGNNSPNATGKHDHRLCPIGTITHPTQLFTRCHATSRNSITDVVMSPARGERKEREREIGDVKEQDQPPNHRSSSRMLLVNRSGCAKPTAAATAIADAVPNVSDIRRHAPQPGGLGDLLSLSLERQPYLHLSLDFSAL